jgi:hypothetical protein
MIQKSEYDIASGLFTGATITTSDPEIEPVPRDGFAWLDGIHNKSRSRLDVASGEVVSYQPPKPADDDMRTWEWSAEDWAWLPVKTQAAIAADLMAHRDRLLDAIVKEQLKALRTGVGLAQVNAYIEAVLALDLSGATDVSWPEFQGS